MLLSLFVPYIPPDSDLTVLPPYAQMATSEKKVDFALTGDCNLVESLDKSVFFPNKGESNPSHIFPAYAFQKYLESKSSTYVNLSTARVVILESSQRGQLLALNSLDPDLGPGFQYTPQSGYRGADYITALVEYEGQRIKIKTKLVVVDAVIDSSGYEGGNSGGGPALDKEANACLYKSNIRRIGMQGTTGRIRLTNGDLS
jgi:hypothetical protein